MPKLNPLQWFRLVTTLLPLLRGLVAVAGAGVVSVVRALIDVVFQVEQIFPAEIDPATGQPRKRGSEKLQAFRELVVAAFATADEAAEKVQARIGDLDAIAAAIVGLFNTWGVLRPREGAQ